MKQFVISIAIVLFSFHAQTFASSFDDFTISTAIRYNSFEDDDSPETDGNQVTVPLGISCKYKEISINLETAYATAQMTPSGEDEASLSGYTDTLISATYLHPLETFPIKRH